jgi:Ni/Co efflux regulator RcnB
MAAGRDHGTMKPTHSKTKCALALALAGMFAYGAAIADKPSSKGGGKSGHEQRSDKGDHGKGDQRSDSRGNDQRSDNRDHGKGDRQDNDRSSRSEGRRDHFEDRHRHAVNEYYGRQFRSGHCPPGLAKKHNGCMPPGQAKKWHMGQPLARHVHYYSVPQQLVLQIGQPPSGYRYVRVGSDILLMSIATRMITDSIQNLGQS